jgi:hypothetical protein
MRTGIALVVLLFVAATFTFAAPKNSPKQPPSSTGILISSAYYFGIQGDGISTTLTFTPSRIPPVYVDGVSNLPNLPLVGVALQGNGSEGNCTSGDTFTATVSGNQLITTFQTAPGVAFQTCNIVLLFHPE